METKEKLKKVVRESKIWAGERNRSHAFLLSPSVYGIEDSKHQTLQQLGQAINDCMIGLSHIAFVAYSKELNCRGAWQTVRNVFSTGVPKMYLEFQGANPNRIPRLVKVDFMVDQNGNFKIAEIDGHNKHGIGYSTLALRCREALYPLDKSMEGVVKMLSDEIKRQGRNELKLFYADQEKFYLPEFEIAQQEFVKNGINCLVVSEADATDDFLQNGLFLDLPFLYHKTDLYGVILEAYRNRRVNFIIPPKPFLGAKGVLAILRNDEKDEHLEALLQSFIKKSALDLMRRFIPETLLIGKQAKGIDFVKERTSCKRYVLKESISSGMKGTVFSDGEDFDETLLRACKANMNWILQEEIINCPQCFSWYDGDKLKTANDWFMRVTAHYVNRNLADVVVTARRDKSVHGAKDCIQLGAIIV